MDEDNSNFAEDVLSLPAERGYLDSEDARALLGTFEYRDGNRSGAALPLFEGIDMAAMSHKIIVSISRGRHEHSTRHLQSDAGPPMSMLAVSVHLEAMFLKALLQQDLGKFAEAAQSCKLILDTVESALPEGVPQNYGTDCKLPEFVTKAVDLLPKLWNLAGDPQQVITSYRRALLYQWDLELETIAKIQKEFAIFLLYGGCDGNPPTLIGSQLGRSFDCFVPTNNVEEAVLLLLLLLRKYALKRVGWDTSVIDHLSFALTVSGGLSTLAHQVEELPPGIMDGKEICCTLALCHYGEGEYMVALKLLRNLFHDGENHGGILELLLASKLCCENFDCIEEGIYYYAREGISETRGKCSQLASVANCLLGVLLSAKSRMVTSDSERILKESDALAALETAERTMRDKDPYIVFLLCLENAEQRKLDAAHFYAKQLMKLEAGCTIEGHVLLARILSAQKSFTDAETVINTALDHTEHWDQVELLRTKAKLQIAQGQLKNAIETYTRLLAVLQIRSARFGYVWMKLPKKTQSRDKSLEMETWHDLANVYTRLSKWEDAEVCLSKTKAINPNSASTLHSTGLLNEAKGLHKEALESFSAAIAIEPSHVPSLISTARALRELGGQSFPVVRDLLRNALRFDPRNHSAWYNLGLLYKAEVGATKEEAVECFQAAAFLEETTPVVPFR
ncbi:Tetratricopeptide repeat protein 7A [Morella rubra]|uniref:Tetratricopeptide repeat protein 7A n=1 Tax=Morella rubra TaxID=262757 RepID=A0A6A1W233_9ROSI|nr:Tetratricopeptide repeat protein 7A [Morella rubra]